MKIFSKHKDSPRIPNWAPNRRFVPAASIFAPYVTSIMGMAGAPDVKDKGEKDIIHPLHVKVLEGKESKEHVKELEKDELPWDVQFLNTTHWKKLPSGEWEIESKTKFETKYVNAEIRDFLGGPVQIARVRTNPDTEEITSIEVIWSEIALSIEDRTAQEMMNFVNVERAGDIKMRDIRNAEKKAREMNEAGRDKTTEYVKAVNNGSEHIQETLEKRFGKPKRGDFGKDRAIQYESLLYKTPDGTTIRFFHKQESMLTAIIEKTETSEKRGEKILLPEKETTDRHAWAKANVVKKPNGDVIIENIPMHNQGTRGYCAGTAYAMILDYWGSPMPLELICNRYFVEGVWGREAKTKAVDLNDIHKATAKETNLDFKSSRISFRKIMQEINEGRPVYAGRMYSRTRERLHIEWREAAEFPQFKIPKFDRKAERIIQTTGAGHATLITGYNKDQEVVIFTESWGEHYRNLRMTWDEWNMSTDDGKMITLEPSERAKLAKPDTSTGTKDIASRIPPSKLPPTDKTEQRVEKTVP